MAQSCAPHACKKSLPCKARDLTAHAIRACSRHEHLWVVFCLVSGVLSYAAIVCTQPDRAITVSIPIAQVQHARIAN